MTGPDLIGEPFPEAVCDGCGKRILSDSEAVGDCGTTRDYDNASTLCRDCAGLDFGGELLPNYLSIPGVTLAEAMKERGLSVAEMAIVSGLSEVVIAGVLAGDVAISPAIAIDLAGVLDIPARLWLRRQALYEKHKARLERKPVEIGTLRLLTARLYGDVLVMPGDFPVYINGTEVSWTVAGERVRFAKAEVTDLGDGMFMLSQPAPARTGVAAEHRAVMRCRDFFNWIMAEEFIARFVWIPKEEAGNATTCD